MGRIGNGVDRKRCGRAAALILATTGAVWTQVACEKRPGRAPAPQSKPAYDADYLAALSVADDFCQAWKSRDVAGGRALMSQRMIRAYPDERLRDALAGAANPRHVAYEISAGRLLPDGRRAFDVRLFFAYEGAHDDRIESPLAQVVLAREPTGPYRVDEFPIPVGESRLRE